MRPGALSQEICTRRKTSREMPYALTSLVCSARNHCLSAVRITISCRHSKATTIDLACLAARPKKPMADQTNLHNFVQSPPFLHWQNCWRNAFTPNFVNILNNSNFLTNSNPPYGKVIAQNLLLFILWMMHYVCWTKMNHAF